LYKRPENILTSAIFPLNGIAVVSRLTIFARFAEGIVETSDTVTGDGVARARIIRIDVVVASTRFTVIV